MTQIFSLLFTSARGFFSVLSKVVLVLFVLVAVISAFNYISNKDRVRVDLTQVHQAQQDQMYAPLTDPKLNATDEGKVMAVIYRNVTCGLFGETCTDNPADAHKYKDGSLFGSVSNIMAMPFSTPPASSIVWAQEGLASAGLVPQAHAAEGIGFSSIKGFMHIWKAFRDVALLLLVLLTVILGFLIMFRAKLDGQTALSIESILPRIVLTMLYISFSFAIAGFLIDMMYVLIGLGIDLIWRQGLGNNIEATMRLTDAFTFAGLGTLLDLKISAYGVGSAFWDLVPLEYKGVMNLLVFKPLALGVGKTILASWTWLSSIAEGVGVSGGLLTANFGVDLGKSLSGSWQAIMNTVVTGILLWVLPGLILMLLITLTMIFFAFRIFFMLLSSYIKIMLYVIFAPIIILFEVFPGANTFSWWIKNLVGELLPFPTVIIVMLTGQMINSVNNLNYNNPLYAGSFGSNTDLLGSINPATEPFRLPFLYGFRVEDFSIIVALGVLLITPDIVKMIKGIVGVKESPLNLGIGTFFAGPATIAGGGLGLATQVGGLTTTMPGVRNYLQKYKPLQTLFGKPDSTTPPST